VEFGDPEHIEFDADDLIDAAVDIYLNPRKSSPTIRDPRQFELTLEDPRRRARIGRRNRHLGGMASIAADRFRLSSPSGLPLAREYRAPNLRVS
jgi:hypothetical protein